jgi:hypothetical protein
MQETYDELFKLQNLLEKTVRNVAASNSLKAVASSKEASVTAPPDNRATEPTGVGRPYYPGSPLKGER